MMLHYTDRKNRIYILTLDDILAEDVYQRLSSAPRLKGAKLIVPGRAAEEFTPDEIDKIALDTMAGRIFIMDTRSQSQAKLQQVYNKIIGYNRADFNHYCYTVLIGDGPVDFFAEDASLESFGPHLARMRLDFNGARFFYDPLAHYESHEKLGLALEHENELLEAVPGWLEKSFSVEGEDVTVRQVRPYFRADGVTGKEGRTKMKRRQRILLRIFTRRIMNQINCQGEDVAKCLGKEGLFFQGESLPLNVYPFHFEKHVAKLLKKAKAAIAS
jgi:hypothetical protein